LLTNRETIFLIHLGAGAKPTAAVRMAGYGSRTMAKKLLSKPRIECAVRELAANLDSVIKRIEAWKAAA
jgi:hypothetical protein